jgi:small neutral amino acid transporter SnatA (MarC family)
LKTGKLLCLIGGLITLVTTFLFAWFFVDEGGNQYYGHGLGVLFSLPTTFGNAEAIALSWGAGVPTFAIYIVGGALIVFLFSWLLILLGIKNRVVPIIGGLIIAGMSLAIIFGPFSVPPNILDYVSIFSSEAWGVFPFNIPIGPVGTTVGGSVGVSLGTYLLLGGGVLGIIGGFLPRD